MDKEVIVTVAAGVGLSAAAVQGGSVMTRLASSFYHPELRIIFDEF